MSSLTLGKMKKGLIYFVTKANFGVKLENLPAKYITLVRILKKVVLLKGKSGLKIIFLKLVYFHSSSPIKHFCENSLLF